MGKRPGEPILIDSIVVANPVSGGKTLEVGQSTKRCFLENSPFIMMICQKYEINSSDVYNTLFTVPVLFKQSDNYLGQFYLLLQHFIVSHHP